MLVCYMGAHALHICSMSRTTYEVRIKIHCSQGVASGRLEAPNNVSHIRRCPVGYHAPSFTSLAINAMTRYIGLEEFWCGVTPAMLSCPLPSNSEISGDTISSYIQRLTLLIRQWLPSSVYKNEFNEGASTTSQSCTIRIASCIAKFEKAFENLP